MTSEPLTVDIRLTRESIGALDTSQLLYMLVDVRGPELEDRQRLPLNICLVIDRSTSMRGERLERVKSAANLVIDLLDPVDTLAVVTFSDRAAVVVPAGPVQNPPVLASHVAAIIASGGTEILAGLHAGLAELTKTPLAGRTNHLVLLTDGHTYGDADACLRLAAQAAGDGVGLSAFGIGAEWNDQFLDRLVSPSGGQSAFIDTPGRVIDYLRERVNGLRRVYAQNLQLVPSFPIGVTIRDAFKVAPYPQPLESGQATIKAGSVEGSRPLSVLLELSIEPQLPGRTLTLPLALQADVPGPQPHRHTVNTATKLPVVPGDPILAPTKSLVEAVRTLNLYRMNEQVGKDIEAGQLDIATKRMRRLTTRLLEAGQTSLAQLASSETERLATEGSLSQEGRKGLKYGTRSLIRRTTAGLEKR
jgi:Ca-activated chloride channel family protein